MREERFKMERSGLIKVGDLVQLTEKASPGNWYYIIEPAVAMSGCYKVSERIHSKSGVVKAIDNTDRGYFVTLELEN